MCKTVLEMEARRKRQKGEKNAKNGVGFVFSNLAIHQNLKTIRKRDGDLARNGQVWRNIIILPQ